MTVIIPHPTEELLITKLQNSILDFYKAKKIKVFRCMPLWIKLETYDFQETAKNLSAIELWKTDFSENCISLLCEVNGKTEKLPLVKFYIKSDSKNKNQEKEKIPFEKEIKNLIDEKIKNPVVLKIYRIADAEFQKNSWIVNDFIWKKNR